MALDNTVNQFDRMDPESREALLALVRGCSDLREVTARVTELALNALMSAEADGLCGARWGERSEGRVNSRNGYRERGLSTTAGDITLRIPKLRTGSYFPDGLIERFRRADAALAACAAEMYVNGVSTRKVEAVARQMGVDSMSRPQVSRLRGSLDAEVSALLSRPLGDQRYCYLWIDATWVRCRVDGKSVSQAVAAAIALGEDGRKHLVGLDVVDTESRASWRAFLSSIAARGLSGAQLVVSDAHGGLVAAVGEVFQGASWQRCVTHLVRDVCGHVARRADRAAAAELVRASLRQRDPLTARACLLRAADEVSRLSAAAGDCLAGAVDDALAFMAFPELHWPKIRTNNVQERANREIKRRYRVVQSFPSRESLVRLVGAVMCEEEDAWAHQRAFSPESTARAWDARAPRVPTAAELKAADAAAERIVAEALDRARAGK